MKAADYRRMVLGRKFAPAKPKRPKYRNVKTVVDGITFASKREASRYNELRLMEKAGKITNLKLQERYRLTIHGHHICDYLSDFVYTDLRTREIVVEDVKSPATRTPVYIVKKKLMLALYGIEIVEV